MGLSIVQRIIAGFVLMLLLLVLLFDQATRALQQLLWHRSEPC